jgi:hypothetical protein
MAGRSLPANFSAVVSAVHAMYVPQQDNSGLC